MSANAKREAFASLSKRFKKKESNKITRPPYNDDITLFDKYCPTCEDTPCVSICQEDIIKIYEDKTVYIDFKEGGCTFCEECAKACPNGVLNLENSESIEAKFSINVNSCLAWQNVVCSSCRDVCYDDAIEFFGLFRPIINLEKCTSCGFCYNVCPPYSIMID
ncbi:4Fe-4S binding protein [Sulfurospirillum sp. 1307]|jgi:ferredoxin-type protein NapF